jgi:hypothetical protein
MVFINANGVTERGLTDYQSAINFFISISYLVCECCLSYDPIYNDSVLCSLKLV